MGPMEAMAMVAMEPWLDPNSSSLQQVLQPKAPWIAWPRKVRVPPVPVPMHQSSVHVQRPNPRRTSNSFFPCLPKWWSLHWACLSTEKRHQSGIIEQFALMNSRPFPIHWRYPKCRRSNLCTWNALCRTACVTQGITLQFISSKCKLPKSTTLAFSQPNLHKLHKTRWSLQPKRPVWFRPNTVVPWFRHGHCSQCL